MYITPKVATNESGTATEGIMVAHTSRRNRKTTSTTSKTLMMSDTVTSCTLARIVVVRSTATLILMVGGMAACKCGISAITLLTVSITLAPGILKTISMIALLSSPGGPLIGLIPATPAFNMFETLSVTVPRSPTRTGAPVCLLYPAMIGA